MSAAVDETLPDDVKALKEELRKAKLNIELQDLMIDIASKELGWISKKGLYQAVTKMQSGRRGLHF